MKKFFKENWKYLLIIFVFAIVSICGTFVAIKMTSGNEIISREGINNNPGPIDLYGTYDMNDLKLDKSIYEYEGSEIDLIQISGLKNKEVEEKINTEIKTISEHFADEGFEEVFMYSNGNFSNILSINMYCNFGFDEDENEEDRPDPKSIYLNYNLNDGSRIKFEDLFTNDANVTLAVRNAIYHEQVEGGFWNALYEIEYEESENYYLRAERIHKEPVYVDDEKVTNMTIEFMNLPDNEKGFSITPTAILLFRTKDYNKEFNYSNVSDSLGEIEFEDNANEIAIYDRYDLGKNLYKEKFAPKDIFTCVDFNQDYLVEEFRGEVSNNLYIDFSRSKNVDHSNDYDRMLSDEEIEKYNEKFNWFIEEEVNNKIIKDLKKEASKDKNCYHVSFITLEGSNVRIYQEELEDLYGYYVPSQAISFRLYINTYKIPKSEWEETYYDRMIETYRGSYFTFSQDKTLLFEDGNPDEFAEGNPHGIVWNSEYQTRLFNFMTGEEVKTLDDMFVDGTITEEELEYELWDQYTNHYWEEISEEEINFMLSEGVDYQFDSDSIRISSKADPDKTTYLYYSDVDIPLFKIFSEEVRSTVIDRMEELYGPIFTYSNEETKTNEEPETESSSDEQNFEVVSDPKVSDTIDKSKFEVETNENSSEEN